MALTFQRLTQESSETPFRNKSLRGSISEEVLTESLTQSLSGTNQRYGESEVKLQGLRKVWHWMFSTLGVEMGK